MKCFKDHFHIHCTYIYIVNMKIGNMIKDLHGGKKIYRKNTLLLYYRDQGWNNFLRIEDV